MQYRIKWSNYRYVVYKRVNILFWLWYWERIEVMKENLGSWYYSFSSESEAREYIEGLIDLSKHTVDYIYEKYNI